jgi:hypothetical protein
MIPLALGSGRMVGWATRQFSFQPAPTRCALSWPPRAPYGNRALRRQAGFPLPGSEPPMPRVRPAPWKRRRVLANRAQRLSCEGLRSANGQAGTTRFPSAGLRLQSRTGSIARKLPRSTAEAAVSGIWFSWYAPLWRKALSQRRPKWQAQFDTSLSALSTL